MQHLSLVNVCYFLVDDTLVTHVHIHTHTYAHTHAHTHTHTRTHTHTHKHKHKHKHTHTQGADSVAEKVPTVLNGGLEAVQPTFWVAFFLLSGVAEAWRMLTIAENPMV